MHSSEHNIVFQFNILYCFTTVLSCVSLRPSIPPTEKNCSASQGLPTRIFESPKIWTDIQTLIHHTQLKVRKAVQNSNFMLVDSPGMIDSPQQQAIRDRGCDFQGVVKWMAERADFVLFCC